MVKVLKFILSGCVYYKYSTYLCEHEMRPPEQVAVGIRIMCTGKHDRVPRELKNNDDAFVNRYFQWKWKFLKKIYT